MSSIHATSLPTGHALREAIRRRERSAEEITRAALHDAESLQGPLHAYIRLLPERALERARRIDGLVRAGEPLGTLAGVPVAVKDLFCLQGEFTTCGSRILENFRSPYSATVVEKLEAAGAIIIGKTNMDEFAMGSSCENSAFFPTRNPWDTTRVPGGSSGGSASTVGARTVPIALGTDTGGSIREPASFCNIVGVKPTYGRVSRYGMIAFASSLDQAGPMTADVRDAADVLEVIAGYDPMDSTSVDVAVPPYASELPDDLHGVRIGIVAEFEASIAQGDAALAALYKQAYKDLERLGAQLVEVHLPHAQYGLATYYLIAPAECSSNLARYDGARYGRRVDGDGDVYAMFDRTRAAGFGDEVKRRIILGTYALSTGYYDAYYVRAQKVRTLIKSDFDSAFAECDVIACPAVSCPPFELGAKSQDPLAMYLMDYFTIPMSLAGIPALSIPAGYVSDLPVGLQIVAPAFHEGRMLAVAHAYEQATQHAAARIPAVRSEGARAS
ncbi:MAG: Asp-tRNA(Asn)/Glu-tRNA(Gln) amidotransferase GatCAB subunit A [Candidatus Eremiobacter antarcticus]|nr:Asp-tRNA(Asn)/Glu-tRNA(Gln) amidotransferase subunit GatA [Candidatus Eremiobacteraeota bacterium]PZR61853.1 MAG: Asp-tRNA(Asn)/Glu-tRNA(Gln) amidotransferase GatCAB subunit A [Candidatus Eremiobacter sp. RRmetagenome_bin22]